MLIRQQGKTVKLLRVVSSAASKRARQVVIGTFRADDGPPAQLLETLGVKERHALRLWLSVYREDVARAEAAPVLACAKQQLEALVAALDVAADTLSPADADALWSQLQELSRSLRRGGHPKPTRSRPAPEPLPGQRDLVDEIAAQAGQTH